MERLLDQLASGWLLPQEKKTRRQWSGLLLLLIFLGVLLAACGDSGASGIEQEPTGGIARDPKGGIEEDPKGGIEEDPTGDDKEVPTIIPDTTKVVEGPAMRSLEGISPEGTFTFVAETAEAEAFLANVQEGDVLAGDVTELAPDGFLRKVVSINRNGGEVSVETGETTLEEAVEQGVLRISEELTMDDLVAVMPAKTGTTAAKIRPGQAPGVVKLEIPEGFELADEVKAEGYVEVELPKFDLDVEIGFLGIERVRFTNTTEATSKLSLTGELGHLGVHSRKKVATMEFKPITYSFGGIPVVVRPHLELWVGLNGDVSADITTSLEHTATLRTEVHYDRVNDWSFENTEFSNGFYFEPPHLTTNANLKAYLGPRLKLFLYGILGPRGELDGYLELKADLFDTPWWELYGGLEAEIGVEVKILGVTLLSYSTKVLDERWPIDSAPGPAPGFEGDGDDPGGEDEFALGDSRTRPLDGMVMVYVPPPDAPFVLESGVDAPQEGYWIDKYEVSNAQYQLCVDAGACETSTFADDERFNGADDPVLGVSWFDAVAYSAWVGGELPTEAEWEYAAVGESGMAYPWGNETSCELANYAGCVGGTTPVDSYTEGASWVGALNMAGNVFEWTASWFDEDENERALRGGSWSYDGNLARAADRFTNLPDDRYVNSGFRVVHHLPSQ